MIFLKTNVKTRSHKYARWNGYMVLHNCRSVAPGLKKKIPDRLSEATCLSGNTSVFWICGYRLESSSIKKNISSIIYCILFTSVHYNFCKYRNINLLYIHVYTRENFSMLTSAHLNNVCRGLFPVITKTLILLRWFLPLTTSQGHI